MRISTAIRISGYLWMCLGILQPARTDGDGLFMLLIVGAGVIMANGGRWLANRGW